MSFFNFAKSLIKIRYYLLILTFLLIIPNNAHLKEINVILNRLQEALQNRDKDAFISLFYIEKEEAKEKLNKFLKSYLEDFPYKEAYIYGGALEEDNNYLPINVIFLSSSDCVIEFWELTIKQIDNKHYIENIYVRNVVSNIRRYKIDLTNAERLKRVEFKIPDSIINFEEAYLFKDGTDQRSSFFIIIGRGEFIFAPSVSFEKVQMKKLVGNEIMKDKIDYLIGMVRPQNIYELIKSKEREKVKVPSNLYSKIKKIWNEQKEKQTSIKWLQKVSSEAIWDFGLEMDTMKLKIATKRFGNLSYNYFPNLPYTIHLYREHPRAIYALYNPMQENARVLKFNIDHPFVVPFYNIEITYDPLKNYFQGYAILTIKSNSTNLNYIELHLNENYSIKNICDENNNSLLFFQNKENQLINLYLRKALGENESIKIRIDYEGIIKPMEPFQDFIVSERSSNGDSIYIKPINFYEGNLYWYPQSILPEFSKAKITIRLPKDYIAFATGKFVSKEVVGNSIKFNFTSYIPTKHLSLMITENKDISVEQNRNIRIFFEKNTPINGLLEKIEKIINYYEEIIGKLPYQSLDFYFHWDNYKGGYSQAGFVILVNKHPLIFEKRFSGEHPLDFPKYQDFYLAHEIAHLWCGQALAWLTYQDQWLSEGFAQFLAAKFIEHDLGKIIYENLLQRFSATAISKSSFGPIILGRRLAMLDKKNEAYGAIVYNKTAIVLKMLEDILGEEAFLNVLRNFYQSNQYNYVTTYDFFEALSKVAKIDLKEFFKDWFFSAEVPQLEIKKYSKDKQIILRVKTIPDFIFPLSLLFKYNDNSIEEKKLIILKEEEFTINLEKPLIGLEIKDIYPFIVKKNE